MIKKIILMSCIAILGLPSVFASKIDGKWKATVETPAGNMEMEYTFKTEGEKLTGSLIIPHGEMPIKNGKIQGDSLFFDVDMLGDLKPVKGKIVGEKIEILFAERPDGKKIVFEKEKEQ